MAVVLVVDDEPHMRRLLVKWLEGAGYQAHEAENGTQAIALTQLRQPDAIIMDVKLPDMTGLAATERIRALPGLRTITVICLTGLDMPIDTAHEGGCTDLLLKPVERDVLLNTLRRQLETGTARRAPPGS